MRVYLTPLILVHVKVAPLIHVYKMGRKTPTLNCHRYEPTVVNGWMFMKEIWFRFGAF